jgi:ABC-2 type transport system permease protein
MTQAAVKYPAVALITLQSSLIYSRDVLLRALTMMIVLFVFIQLWTFTYGALDESRVAGFSLRDMIWYLVITETVALSAPRVSLKIDEEVKSGALAYVLAKPYNYVLYHLAGYWGEGLLRIPANFAVGSVLALIAVGAPDTSVPGVMAMAIALAVSITFNFFAEASIGLSAFWVEDSQPFFWIYQKFVFTLGGLFLPLEFLPKLLGDVARVLPLAAVAYTPGKLFVGFTWEEFAVRAALQLFWLGAVAGLCWFIYARAERKVNVHGG